jgi:PAS domain S-box-containing protein
VSSETQHLDMPVKEALERLQSLRDRSGVESRDDLLQAALDELGTCLEELLVTSEVYRQQSAELAATRKELTEERTAFQMLFEFAPDGYLVTDNIGIIRRANRMAGELFGVARDYLVKKPLSVFVALAARTEFRALVRRLAGGNGSMVSFDANLVARGGRAFTASIRVATGGKELRWTIRDVTEQRRDQQALRDAHQRLAAHAEVLQHEVDEREVTADRLRQSEGRQRQLSTHLHAFIEEERARIAREVHDELGAALTAVRFELGALRAYAKGNALVQQAAAESIKRVDAAIQSTRRICSDLRPSLLDHMGLWPAIEWLVEDVAVRAGIRATVDVNEGGEVPDPARATAIFRIVQEALTNVVRHSGASSLRVAARANGGDVAIEVADDGCGIKETELARPDAFGIIGMQERARACGGEVAVERGIQGTRVKLRVPLTGGGEACAS